MRKIRVPLRYRCLSVPVFLSCMLSAGIAGAQISLTASGGSSGFATYTTLKSAFDAINAGSHTGAIAISVTGNTTETATAVLNASGTGSASYSGIQIRPATGTTPVISGSIPAASLIRLAGACNVTIDGSNNGTTSRDLTLSNTSATAPTVVYMSSTGTTAISGDTLKNCQLFNGATTSSTVVVSDAISLGTPGYSNNLTIRNNSVRKGYIGIYLSAVHVFGNGTGMKVADNDVAGTGTGAVRLCGIYLQGISGATVTNNAVGNIDPSNDEFDRGIWLATGTSNTSVSGNTVTGLDYTGTGLFAPIGINVAPDVISANIQVTDNTVSNLNSAGTATTIGLYLFSSTSGISMLRNRISNIGNSNTGGYGSAGIYLAGLLNTSNTTVANNFVWDVRGYGANGYSPASNGNGIVVDGGGGYNIWHNTVALNTDQTQTGTTHAAALLVTANVTGTGAINLQNNIFANLQTVGGAGSRHAFVSLAPNAVFSTINRNDYYAASGNLVYANASLLTTLSQIQTGVGGNTASVSALPVFTTATDLHLPLAGNAALHNTGASVPGISADIDADPRMSPPDIGADEFGNCPMVTSAPTNATVCAKGTVSLSGTAAYSTQYQWQISTGNTFSNVANGGIYSGANTPTLTITNVPASLNGAVYKLVASSPLACATAITAPATLTVKPAPSDTVTAASATSICTGGSVMLNGPTGTGLTYQWQKNGTNIGGATGSSYTASAIGNYSVLVTSTINGCAATSAPLPVTQNPGPTATIAPAGLYTICQNAPLSLAAGNVAGATYQWLLNGAPIAGATGATYSAGAAGSYSVIVNTGNACVNTSPITTVSVNAAPTATITQGSSLNLCQGQTAALTAVNPGAGHTCQWQFNGTDITPGGNNLSYPTTVAGNYSVRITNTSSGCQATSGPVAVTFSPVPVPFISPASSLTLCQGDSVMLSTGTAPGFSYQWQLNGAPIAGAVASSYKATAAGAYTVAVTNAGNCSDIAPAVTVTVNPSPVSQITYNSPLAFCEGSAVVLNAIQDAGYTYQWQESGQPLSGAGATIYIVSQSGNYTLLVTNQFNCARISSPVPVTVYPKPQPVITQAGKVLSVGNYATYQWYFQAQPISGATAGTYTMTQTGPYRVRVTDANGCTNMSDYVFVSELGVGSSGLAAGIRLFPNPATDLLFIENKGGDPLESVTLLNSIGAIVLRESISEKGGTLTVAHLPSGMYTVRLKTTHGTASHKLQILK